MTSDTLGLAAYVVVEQLSAQIGPRPAGSDGEQRALDYVEGQLRASCHEVRRMPVKGIPGQLPARMLMVVGLVWLLYSIYHLIESPVSMLIFVVAFFAVPKLVLAARKRASATADRRSANIAGCQRAALQSSGSVILCAHVDSAKANQVPGELWPKVNRLIMRALVPFVFIMTAAAVFRWLDGHLTLAPPALWEAVRAMGLAVAGFLLAFQLFYTYISRGDSYSPGANDNASGVGVVLALARHLSDAPLARLDMHYVLFTAEEVGLIGSERFAKQTDLPRQTTYVINLDMVGAGKQLCYVRGSGLIPPRFTDSELNGLLREACPTIGSHYYFLGNSDFASLAASGFRAASLCTKGDSNADTVYHTEGDTVEHIDPAALQLTAATVLQAIRLLDARLGSSSDDRP